jgi:hypothetical protein
VLLVSRQKSHWDFANESSAHYVNRETAVGIFYVIELFLGGSTGAYTQSSFAVIQSVLPPEEGADGLALMLIGKFSSHCLGVFIHGLHLFELLTASITAQLGGMTLGLSISGAVFVNTAVNNLESALGLPRVQISQLVAGASNHVLETLSPDLRNLTLDTIVASWQKTFIIIYVGAAASLVVAIFFRNGKANVVAAGHA